MSKETRTIRPYSGLDPFERALEGVLLYHGEEACSPDRSIAVDLDAHEFLLRPVSLQWASDEAAFASFKETMLSGASEVGLDLADLSIVAIATTPYLKLAEIVFRRPLSALSGLQRLTTLTEPSRSRVFDAAHSGFSVDASVVLDRSLSPQPLRPYTKGTWLARARFTIETKLGPAFLPPTPLTDEVRRARGLPANTIRYVHLGDHDPLLDYVGQEQPTFYVDEDLLAQLNARRNAPESRALQVQLAHDFVPSVVNAASRRAKDLEGLSYPDVRSSLMGSVVRIAAGPGASDEERDAILAKVMETPEVVVARAEHWIGLKEAYAAMLEETDS